nr:hypothetical protein REQ54_04391 [Rhizobium sp. Q54]
MWIDIRRLARHATVVNFKSQGFILRNEFNRRSAHITINNTDEVLPLVALQNPIQVQRDYHFCHILLCSTGLILVQIVRVKQVAKVQATCQRSL